MNLTAEEFGSIVKSLGGAQGGKKGSEKRRASRIEYSGFVEVVICDQNSGSCGRPVRAQVCDLSSRGIALYLPEALASGSQFIVQFPQYPNRQVRILCTVAHARPQADKRFNVGAEFTCVLPSQPGANKVEDLSRIRQSILR